MGIIGAPTTTPSRGRREEVLEGKIDSLMRRMEKMEVEKR